MNIAADQPARMPMRSGWPIEIASYTGCPTRLYKMSISGSSIKLPMGYLVFMQHGYTLPFGSTETSEPAWPMFRKLSPPDQALQKLSASVALERSLCHARPRGQILPDR